MKSNVDYDPPKETNLVQTKSAKLNQFSQFQPIPNQTKPKTKSVKKANDVVMQQPY